MILSTILKRVSSLTFLTLFCVPCVFGYPETPAFCGEPLGVHAKTQRAATTGSGSFSMTVSAPSATSKSVTISGGKFEGYLLQAFNGNLPNAGLIGTFTTIPTASMHYLGCFSNPKASLSQNQEHDFQSLTATWSGTAAEAASVQFVTYVVKNEEEYFVVKSNNTLPLPKEPCIQQFQHVYSIVGVVAALVVVATVLTLFPPLYDVRSCLTQRSPIGMGGAYAKMFAMRGNIADTCTFGCLSELARMSWAETFVVASFLFGQVLDANCFIRWPPFSTLVPHSHHFCLPPPLAPTRPPPAPQLYSFQQGLVVYNGLGPQTLVMGRVLGNLIVVNMSLLLIPVSR